MTSDSKKAMIYAFAEFLLSEQNKWTIYPHSIPMS